MGSIGIPMHIYFYVVKILSLFDMRTKEFIQKRLSYRYLVVQTDDSDKFVRRLERELQNNEHGFGVPKLNGNQK